MLTQNTEVEIKDFTTVPVRCLTCDFVHILNNCRMGYHPRLEPFKFLSAHQGVVGNPTEKKKREQKRLV